MSSTPRDSLEDLWREHKKHFGEAPSLDWAHPDIMTKALRAALERGEPCTREALRGDNVVSINRKKVINCRVFM